MVFIVKVAYNMEMVKEQNLPKFMVEVWSRKRLETALHSPHNIYSRFLL